MFDWFMIDSEHAQNLSNFLGLKRNDHFQSSFFHYQKSDSRLSSGRSGFPHPEYNLKYIEERTFFDAMQLTRSTRPIGAFRSEATKPQSLIDIRDLLTTKMNRMWTLSVELRAPHFGQTSPSAPHQAADTQLRDFPF
jgi:hypothetical protein